MSEHQTWLGRTMARSRSRWGYTRCAGCGALLFGFWSVAAKPIWRISRTTRAPPTRCPSRRRWRTICREP